MEFQRHFRAITVALLLTSANHSLAADRLPRELPASGKVPDRVRRHYTNLIRPHFVLRGATVIQMLDFLKRSNDAGAGTVTVTHAPREPKTVSIDETNISQCQIIDKLCAASGLYWRYTPTGVEIGPRESLSP